MIRNTLLAIPLFLLSACSEPNRIDESSPSEKASFYQGEEATRVREETIIELLAVKESVQQSIEINRDRADFPALVSDLETLRQRLEYIKTQTSMLPQSERRVILGNLAVATNQLREDLDAILEAAPGDDDLAMEIANLRQQLDPIELAAMIQRQ